MNDINKYVQEELIKRYQSVFYIALFGCGGVIYRKHLLALLGRKNATILKRLEENSLIKQRKIGQSSVIILKHAKLLQFPFERRESMRLIGKEFQTYYNKLLKIFDESNADYKNSLNTLLFKERFHEQDLVIDAYFVGENLYAAAYEEYVARCKKVRENGKYCVQIGTATKKTSAYAALESFGVARTVYSDFVSYNNCEKDYDKKMFVNLSFALGLSYNLAERLMNFNGYTLNSRGRTFDKMCSMALRCGFSRDMTIALIDKENAVMAKKFSPFTSIPNLTKNAKKK